MTSRTPEVSVLVTVHNREPYLGHALTSILESDHTDFEVVVVDDGSSDRSLDIALQFAKEDERIQVHANERNLGDYSNRMKAASLASGRYLKYLDSDDLIYPHSLAILLEGMKKYPDAALGLSHSMPEDDSPYPWRLLPEETYRKHFLGRGCLGCGPSGAIIRREAFEAVGGFDPKWGVISDTELWCRLAARWPTILFPPGLVWWRRHQGQEFSKESAGIVYLQKGYELTRAVVAGPRCPLTEFERIAVLDRSRQHLARRLISLAVRERRMGSALRVFRNSGLAPLDIFRGFLPYK